MGDNLDLDLKLLRGKPILVDNIKVHPPTLDDIVDISVEKYHKYLNLLCIDEKTIQKLLNLDEKVSMFEFVYFNCTKDIEYRQLIFEAFDFFLREKVEICDFGFYLGEINENKIIHEEKFNEVTKIIKLQNCITEKEEEEKFKPANNKARQILEQMKKNQEELEKTKGKNSLDLHDLISIFSAYSDNTNILNVWDLSFYQFNDQFNRLKIMQDYNANLQILMHCDTSKNKIDLKHWMSPGQ